MNGTMVFFSASGEKLADAVGTTGIAPINSEVIKVNLSARNITGAQKDNNALHILTKDNQKLVINDFFSNKTKKLVLEDGNDLFLADYTPGENFNGLQFKPLKSMDAAFDGSDAALFGNDTLSWAVPLIAVAAAGGIAIAAKNRSNHKNNDSDNNPTANLGAAKAQASQTIGEMTYLNAQQKADAHQAVENATDIAGINKALQEAHVSNLNGAKEGAHKAIDEMANLSVQQKEEAHKAIDDAASLPQVEQTLADTTQLNQDGITEGPTLPSFLDQITQAIENIATAIWDKVTAIPKQILLFVKNIISTFDDKVIGFIDKILDFIDSPLEFVGNIIESIKQTVETAIDKIVSIISDPFGAIGDVIDHFMTKIDYIISLPGNIINDTINTVVDHLSSKVTFVSETVNWVVDSIFDFFAPKPPIGILTQSSDSLVLKTAIADIALYSDHDTEADIDVVSLADVDNVSEATTDDASAHTESLALQETNTPAVSEELSVTYISSLLEDNNSNDINLDNIIGEESELIVALDNTLNSHESIDNTVHHDVPEQYTYQLLLSEESYSLAAA